MLSETATTGSPISEDRAIGIAILAKSVVLEGVEAVEVWDQGNAGPLTAEMQLCRHRAIFGQNRADAVLAEIPRIEPSTHRDRQPPKDRTFDLFRLGACAPAERARGHAEGERQQRDAGLGALRWAPLQDVHIRGETLGVGAKERLRHLAERPGCDAHRWPFAGGQ